RRSAADRSVSGAWSRSSGDGSVTRVGGRYEILGELGRGGMATVHLARQTDLDRLVALKELSGVASADSAAAARFLREARFAGSPPHPHTLPNRKSVG